MKILGIDTTSHILSIAVSEDRDVLKERSYIAERTHSKVLIDKIESLLNMTKMHIDDIEGFIVGLGPGSFTGIRIGVSAVKGFGIATGSPCLGVASIDAIALNTKNRDVELIVPVLDAKRRQVYSAIYLKQADSVKRLTGYLLIAPEALCAEIERYGKRSLLLGDGIAAYKGIFKEEVRDVLFAEERLWYPSAANLIRLGFDKIKKQKEPNLSRLLPIYIYPKDCQVKKE